VGITLGLEKKKLAYVTDEERCHPKHKYEQEVERWTIFWNEVALSNGWNFVVDKSEM